MLCWRWLAVKYVYSIGQKLNSVRRQYKAKKGLLFMYFLVMKWMKNEVSLVLCRSLARVSRLSSDSSKLLLSFCFLRIWLQVFLHLKKKQLEGKSRISVWRDRMFSTALFSQNKQLLSGRTPLNFPTEFHILLPHSRVSTWLYNCRKEFKYTLSTWCPNTTHPLPYILGLFQENERLPLFYITKYENVHFAGIGFP